MKSLVPCNKN